MDSVGGRTSPSPVESSDMGNVSPTATRIQQQQPIPAKSRPEMPTLDTNYSMSAESTTSTIRAQNRPRDNSSASAASENSRHTRSITSADRRRSPMPPTATQSPQVRTQSPERVPPRPKPARRMSSKLPQRGQEFSVDDDESEILQDLRKQKMQRTLSRTASTGFSAMRRMPSMRRRVTTATLREDEEAEDISEQEAIAEDTAAENDDGDETDDSEYEASDAGTVDSFTLKDRQEAINVTHPFGIKIWKPSLYKKDRSVQRLAEGEIHSVPGRSVGNLVYLGNFIWLLVFGWWMALAATVGAFACFIFAFTEGGWDYANAYLGLASYIIYPFGRCVQLDQDDTYIDEDEGEGRSIGEYERWQGGDLEGGGTRTFFEPQSRTPRLLVGHRRESVDNLSETNSLLGADERRGLLNGEIQDNKKRRRLFGRGKWTMSRIVFFLFFYLFIGPIFLLVCGFCWLFVFTIPMAKVTSLLLSHLRRHPLALSFLPNGAKPKQSTTSSVLVCTYRAVGLKYYKYTIDGTNIFFINLISVVFFVIFDNWFLAKFLKIDSGITSPAFLFTLSLFSIIPLAYFIGQAVASVSAQSSMGVASVLNAFFSTIVEVFLYCIALMEGKSRLVEGSLIGSVLAGILLMPGLAMCAGTTYRKTQYFNVKSAEATVTMLLFAVIAAFAPTLFYQIYGTYEFNCRDCNETPNAQSQDCRRCYFTQVPTVEDQFYLKAVRPFCYIAAVFLVIAYVIGCVFTLKTHSNSIWQTQPPPPPQQVHKPIVSRPPSRSQGRPGSISSLHGISELIKPANGSMSVKDSVLYKRILGQSLQSTSVNARQGSDASGGTVHIVPPHTPAGDREPTSAASQQGPDPWMSQESPAVAIPSLTNEENLNLTREVAEMAATAATAAVAAVQDVQRHLPDRKSIPKHVAQVHVPYQVEEEAEHGGHDAPNWGRAKSMIILCGATVLYAAVAEILVSTVDVVLENVKIDEKFLGITLFALVPNSTEFLNAISFAINGNVALSMEIGSAYALQVCLLQMPALVLFTAFTTGNVMTNESLKHMFTLIFPQWDLVTVIMCVFLLTNIVHEGKSNYFKGSILILAYATVMLGFYFSGFIDGGNYDQPSMMSMNSYRTQRGPSHPGFVVGNKIGHANELWRTAS